MATESGRSPNGHPTFPRTDRAAPAVGHRHASGRTTDSATHLAGTAPADRDDWSALRRADAAVEQALCSTSVPRGMLDRLHALVDHLAEETAA